MRIECSTFKTFLFRGGGVLSHFPKHPRLPQITCKASQRTIPDVRRPFDWPPHQNAQFEKRRQAGNSSELLTVSLIWRYLKQYLSTTTTNMRPILLQGHVRFPRPNEPLIRVGHLLTTAVGACAHPDQVRLPETRICDARTNTNQILGTTVTATSFSPPRRISTFAPGTLTTESASARTTATRELSGPSMSTQPPPSSPPALPTTPLDYGMLRAESA